MQSAGVDRRNEMIGARGNIIRAQYKWEKTVIFGYDFLNIRYNSLFLCEYVW